MYLCRTKFSNIKRFFPASPIFLHRHHNLHIIFDDKEPLSRHSCFMHDFWQGVVVVVQRNPIIFQDIYCCSYSKEGTFVSSFTLCSRNSVFFTTWLNFRNPPKYSYIEWISVFFMACSSQAGQISSHHFWFVPWSLFALQ